MATFQRNIWKLAASERLVLKRIESLRGDGVNDGSIIRIRIRIRIRMTSLITREIMIQ